MGAHLLAGGDVLVVHAAGFGDDGGFDLGDRSFLCGEVVVEIADLVDAPEEIDGGGAGFGERLGDDGDFCGEGREGGRGAAVDADGHAHGGRDADGGSAADDHVADDGGDLLVVGGEDVGLFEGELGLVEEVNAGWEPFEGGNHYFYCTLAGSIMEPNFRLRLGGGLGLPLRRRTNSFCSANYCPAMIGAFSLALR